MALYGRLALSNISSTIALGDQTSVLVAALPKSRRFCRNGPNKQKRHTKKRPAKNRGCLNAPPQYFIGCGAGAGEASPSASPPSSSDSPLGGGLFRLFRFRELAGGSTSGGSRGVVPSESVVVVTSPPPLLHHHSLRRRSIPLDGRPLQGVRMAVVVADSNHTMYIITTRMTMDWLPRRPTLLTTFAHPHALLTNPRSVVWPS